MKSGVLNKILKNEYMTICRELLQISRYHNQKIDTQRQSEHFEELFPLNNSTFFYHIETPLSVKKRP